MYVLTGPLDVQLCICEYRLMNFYCLNGSPPPPLPPPPSPTPALSISFKSKILRRYFTRKKSNFWCSLLEVNTEERKKRKTERKVVPELFDIPAQQACRKYSDNGIFTSTNLMSKNHVTNFCASEMSYFAHILEVNMTKFEI